MRTHQKLAATLTLAALVVLALAGCSGGAKSGSTAKPALPDAFTAAGSGAELAITAEGGGVAVATGEARAAVSVPAGAVAAGTTWKVVPLASAPKLAERALCPGVYVDTAGKEPTAPCAIGFSILGTASPDACIVKLAEDGSIAEVMPTTRVDLPGVTLLSAYVDGFSAYTTAEEDAAARDKAFVDREKARGKQVDWTIKAGGTETQEEMGWKFEYELDLFASGGAEGMGGIYKGHGSLMVSGKYEESLGVVQSLGTISGTARDDNLTFSIIDASLASLLTGEDVTDPIISGSGIIHGKGLASLNLSATAPNVQGKVDKNNIEGDSPVPFKIEIAGEDVKIYIDKVGIFPGKILRTSQ